MSKKQLVTKLMGKHSKDCYAIENFNKGIWDTPWAFIDDLPTYGTKTTPVRKNGKEKWVWVACNCTRCPASIAILERSILVMLEKGQADG